MPRVLSVARAAVAPEHEAEYLAVLRALAKLLRTREQRVWAFRHPERPGTYLEFTETRDPGRHRVRAPGGPDEAALEARLRAVARYDADAAVLWNEVPLEDA